MTIQEMHIGIDLGIQRLNSNVFGKLLPEAKDYFINTVTQEFVKLALTDEKNTVYDIVTYADIREYYERLQTYIVSVELGLIESLGDGYVYGDLPNSITIGQLTSGVLYQGVTYKVITPGTINLSTFGGNTVSSAGDIFTCDIDAMVGASAVLIAGEKYRIVNAHDGDFTINTVGASSNTPGTVFTSATGATITGDTDTTLQNLTKSPVWLGAILVPVSDIGYYMNIKSRSSIAKGNVISTGDLTVGKKYIVSTAGSTDLSTAGGVANPDVGYIFTCNADVTLSWSDGTLLYEVVENGNRLVKVQDVDDFLENSFGSTPTSPISIFAGNKLRVYHDNKFSIKRIHLDYIRKPITVSFNNEIDSDLPESTQPFLVDLVVKKISALSGNPTYQAQVNEVNDTVND